VGFLVEEEAEISLSRNLGPEPSWDAVCEVLLHEIAHQFNEESLCRPS